MASLCEVPGRKKSWYAVEKTFEDLFEKRIRGVQKKSQEISLIFFVLRRKRMPRKIVPKIYKIKKDREDPSILQVRYKNLDKKQLREFKQDLDAFCQAYFKDTSSEKSEY